jgi:hypothetical protein
MKVKIAAYFCPEVAKPKVMQDYFQVFFPLSADNM